MPRAGFNCGLKPGDIIHVLHRGLATVVYHNLDGYGVVWGEQQVDVKDLPAPEAMLRKPYPGSDVECVGEFYRRAKRENFQAVR